MKVRLVLFAVLRDIVGTGERQMELPEGTTAQDVWAELRRDHPGLEGVERPPMTAVNMSYVTAETPLREGDELAFIPPVSGG